MIRQPFTDLSLKVCPREFERVEEGVGGRQPDVVARLLLLHAVHDGGEDVVGLVFEAPVVDVLRFGVRAEGVIIVYIFSRL